MHVLPQKIKVDIHLKNNNSQASKTFLYKVSLEKPNNNTQRRIWSFAKRWACYVHEYGVCSVYVRLCTCTFSRKYSGSTNSIQRIPLSLFPILGMFSRILTLGMQYNKHLCSSKETKIINSNIVHRCHQKKYLQPWAPTRSPLLHTCKGCRNLEGQSSPKKSQGHSRNPRLKRNRDTGRCADLGESSEAVTLKLSVDLAKHLSLILFANVFPRLIR